MSMGLGGAGIKRLAISTSQLPTLAKAFKPLNERLAVSPGISSKSTPLPKPGIGSVTFPLPKSSPSLPVPFAKPRQLNFAPLKPAEFSTKMLHNVAQAGVNLLSKFPSQVPIYNQLGKVAKMAGKVSELIQSAQSLSNAARTADVGRTGQGVNVQKGVRELARMINGGKGNDAIQKRWESLVSAIAGGGRSVDPMALVQDVLRESYLDNINGLRNYAEKIKHFNEQKKAIRDHLTEARNQYADFRASAREGIDPEGGSGSQAQKFSTKEELAGHIQKMEEQLQTVGDDAQLANIDLQNMLQKQQQTLQMLSNISKTLHDTAMAIVRKIGG